MPEEGPLSSKPLELGRRKEATNVEDADALIRALADEDPGVRCEASIALGRVRDGHAVEPLLAILEDRWMHVREAAARALGEIGDVRAIRPLCALLSGYSDGRAAAEALVKLGPPAIDDVASVLAGKPDIIGAREMAAKVLGLIGDARAVDPLVAALHSRVGFRSLCTPWDALVSIGAPAVPRLTSAMQGGDALVAGILVKIGTPAAMDALVAALMDEREEVRNAAALALAET